MKPIPSELEAKIDEIHSWMFDGDLDKVAKKAKKTKGWVSKVLNKRVQPNAEIITAAIKVMNENKALFEINATMKVAS
jgi:hypothetical protein